jgi:hypothetical protein
VPAIDHRLPGRRLEPSGARSDRRWRYPLPSPARQRREDIQNTVNFMTIQLYMLTDDYRTLKALSAVAKSAQLYISYWFCWLC